jgi:hypothetical protein
MYYFTFPNHVMYCKHTVNVIHILRSESPNERSSIPTFAELAEIAEFEVG